MQLQLENLSKKYGTFLALDDVSLNLSPGIYALLGPNGAGKSTMMKLITGVLEASGGEILLDNISTKSMGKEYRNILGYMPQQQGLYESFTAYRFLSYIAALKGMDKTIAEKEIKKVLGLVNLSGDENKYLGEMSGGMKQRILIAQAVMNNPKILILDEPTAGLDPKERIRIRNIISRISADKIVIFATHVVSDIEQIAKEVILLKKGKVIAINKSKELCRSIKGKVFEIGIDKDEFEILNQNYRISNVYQGESKMIVRVISDCMPPNIEATEVFPRLEDVYLYYFEEEEEL